jgi:hypothetical protein
MAEKHNEAPSLQQAERYYSEYIQLDSEKTAESPRAMLQESINKGARQSWKLVGVVQDPTRFGGIFVIWDTSGFISG